MNLFDIVGPIMVGPSSSHTAGAVRIGYVARKLLGEPVRSATINLYGSFLATGAGHGTKNALMAGLLGMKTDDSRIPESFDYAQKEGVDYSFGEADLKNAHPNSVELILEGRTGRSINIVGESVGGGRINITRIDGQAVNFSGEYPTIIVHNQDKPGLVSEVTGMLAKLSVNIATMQLYRSNRGGEAIMIVECDQEVDCESVAELSKLPGVKNVIYYSLM